MYNTVIILLNFLEYIQDTYIVDNCTDVFLNFTVDNTQYSYGYKELFYSYYGQDCFLDMRPLEHNPDNVVMVIGTQVYQKYCQSLDYKNNKMGFALKTDHSL